MTESIPNITESESARLGRVHQQREFQVDYLLQLVRDNFANGDELAERLVPLTVPRVTFSQNVPSRRERLGVSGSDLKVKWPDPLPNWLQFVDCPRCGGAMTPLKAKAPDSWGEVITYQCHNLVDDSNTFCLVVLTITDGVRYFMRPGDFTSSDFDWTKVAPDTIPARASTTDPDKQGHKPFVPEHRPPSWDRNTLMKPIYDAFWDEIMVSGRVEASDLSDHASKMKPDTPKDKILEAIRTLPSWMKAKTGYVVKSSHSGFEVLGRGEGSTYEWPFSDVEYRKLHNFQ